MLEDGDEKEKRQKNCQITKRITRKHTATATPTTLKLMIIQHLHITNKVLTKSQRCVFALQQHANH